MRNALFVALVLVGAASCASYTKISPEDRAAVERDAAGLRRERYLRVSMFATPFFGDDSKRLLTAVPPDEVRLLNNPAGQPINPGQVEKVLPVGSRARILKVEFPTAWVVTERVLYTPRTWPWVYVAVEGEPPDKPFIVVLPPSIRSQQEFYAELERFLTDQDPATVLKDFSQPVREAVNAKRAIEDMPAAALEMAWGYPERKRIVFEDGVQKEEWVYPGEKRVAHLAEGRVRRLDGG